MFDADDNDLHASIKALKEVVLPALDAGNPIAQQQLRYVIDYLSFHRQRRALQPRLERALLLAHLSAARQVLACVPPPLGEALRAAVTEVEPHAEAPADWQARTVAHVSRLEDETAALVRAASTLEDDVRSAVARAVVASSQAIVALQRAWAAPLSIEPDPAALPPIERLLGEPADAPIRGST